MLAALGKHGITKRTFVTRVLPEVMAGVHERMRAPGKHASQTCRPFIEATSHATPPAGTAVAKIRIKQFRAILLTGKVVVPVP